MRPVPSVRSNWPEAVTAVGTCTKWGHHHLVQLRLDDCRLRDDAEEFATFWDMEDECGVVWVVAWRYEAILVMEWAAVLG